MRRNALIAVCFFDALSGGILFPILPFRFQDLGATPMEVALLLALTPVASAFVAPVIGAWSDRSGRFWPMLAAATMSSATFVAYAFAAQLWEVALLRIFGSLCNTTVALCHASACDIADGEKTRSDLFRKLAATTPAGFVIGPILAALVEPMGASAPFLLGGLVALLPVSVIAVFLRPGATSSQANQASAQLKQGLSKEIWTVGRHVITSKPVLIILCIIVLGTVARTFWSTSGGMFLTEAAETKLSHEMFSLFISAAAVVEFAAVIWLFPLFRQRFSDVGSVAIGAVGFTLGIAVLMRSQDWWALSLAVVGIGVGLSFLRPATRNVLAEHAPQGSYGTLMAFSEASMFGSKTIATVLSGLLFGWGALLPLVVSAVGHILVIGLIVVALVAGLISRGVTKRAT